MATNRIGFSSDFVLSNGNIGIGITNPQAQLHITGQFQSTQANSVTTGAGQIYLNGATGNRIDFAGVGYATPATTTRSVGTKIVLDPQITASNVDYAIGVENTAIWSSVPSSASQFKWYAGTTNIATLFGTGELVLGTTALTGTASQPLQVTGGAYVSGNLGVGVASPSSQLHITGQFQSTQANSVTTGAGQIYLNGATGNRIDFNGNGVAAPAFTTRSVGTKIVLTPAVGASTVDFAFGIENGTLWSSVESSSAQFKWYAGTTNIATLFGTGELVLGTTSKTGTASQPLQVTGGAYVSGNLGVGVASPSYKLDLQSSSNDVLSIKGGTNATFMVFDNNSLDDYKIGGVNVVAPFVVYNNTDARYEMVFDGTGNVLIGSQTSTGTASQTLQVTGGAYVSGNLGVGVASPSEKTTINGNILLDYAISSSAYSEIRARYIGQNNCQSAIRFYNPNNAYDGAVTIWTQPNSNGASMIERARFDGSGNLGIGTVSPAENLHIHNPNTSLAVIRLSGSAASQTPFNIRQGIVGTSNAGFSIYDVNNSATRFAINSSGNIGIGTNDPTYKLHVNGSFGATTKSFIIDHPTKEGKKLQYGSLEGPELGVYVRGRTQESIIELPDYWTGLVREETITVNITAIGNKNIWVEKIEDNKVYINSEDVIDCFYTIFGERKDVDKLEVEV